MKQRVAYLLIALLGLLSTVPGRAADLNDLAADTGSERENRLLAGARKEGELTLYTSLTVEDMQVLNTAFERKYAIKVKMWRASADKVLQRTVTEAKGGRFDVDIVEANALPLEALHREGLLAPVRSPHHAHLIPQAVPAHRGWVGSRLNVFVQSYNTGLVKKAQLPQKFADLLDPRWKGQLGIEASDDDWLAAVIGALGEQEGLALFRALAAKNGVSVRKGHTLLTNLVASGEVPLALTVYNFTAEQMKQKGAPLDWFVLPPAVARATDWAWRSVHRIRTPLSYTMIS